jgi:hypothetical protein
MSDAARASPTDRSRIESALLPNQIGEKGEGQIVVFGSGHKRVAELFFREVRSPDVSRRGTRGRWDGSIFLYVFSEGRLVTQV